MEKHLPGSTIIVKNVPGAGHIIGANEIYRSRPDGRLFGTFNRGLPLAQLCRLKGVKFDLTKMSWLGSPSSEMVALVVNPKYQNLKDVMKAPTFRIATAGIGDSQHITAELFRHTMKLNNWKIVTGYKGGEAELAIMRGEIDGQFGSWSSMESSVTNGQARPVMFIGKEQPEGYEKVPLLRDVLTEERYQSVVHLLEGLNLLARPFAGPPGIPEDQLKILRDAFKESVNDPELLDIAKKTKRPIKYIGPEEAMTLMKSMINLKPELVTLIRRNKPLACQWYEQWLCH